MRKATRNGVVTVHVSPQHRSAPAYSWGKGYVIRGADDIGESHDTGEVTADLLAKVFEGTVPPERATRV